MGALPYVKAQLFPGIFYMIDTFKFQPQNEISIVLNWPWKSNDNFNFFEAQN